MSTVMDAMKLNESDNKCISDIKEKYYNLTERELLHNLRAQFESYYGLQKYKDYPKVFIYTPTYNRADILKERALQSVLAQTYKNFEYLIVSDGSTDKTEDVIKNCGDYRVKLVKIMRNWRYPPTADNHWLAGPVMAANTALRLANGDWIARIDDDDYWVEDHLERSLKIAIDGNYEFVSGRAKEYRYGEGIVTDYNYLYSEYFGTEKKKRESDDNPKIGATSSIVYRSYLSRFEYNIDCWRKGHNRVNDIDLYVRLGMMGVRMGWTNSVEFINRPHSGSETVGSDAYRNNVDMIESFYRFN